MQFTQEISSLQNNHIKQNQLIRTLFKEIQQATDSIAQLKFRRSTLKQCKSTIVLQTKPTIQKRKASLTTDKFIDECVKRIEIANQSPPPKKANRIKGRLEKHIPEAKTQEEQLPQPTITLQSIFQQTNSPQQRLSKILQQADFNLSPKPIHNNQIYNIHEEGQLQN